MKFKVGDKISILKAESIEAAVYCGYKNGDEALVVEIDNDGNPCIPDKNNPESYPLVIVEEELKYIKKIKKSQRIAELEERLSKLEQVNKPIQETQDVQRRTVKCDKTPNQLRKGIIEKAKKIIQAHKDEKGYHIIKPYACKTDFIVDIEKRTVIALLRGKTSNKVRGYGIAICSPNDVFNEHIGKAIALGRALGIDVSEFEQAVQPTEVVVGHSVYWSEWGFEEEFEVQRIEGNRLYDKDDSWIQERNAKIIDDTNAEY